MTSGIEILEVKRGRRKAFTAHRPLGMHGCSTKAMASHGFTMFYPYDRARQVNNSRPTPLPLPIFHL